MSSFTRNFTLSNNALLWVFLHLISIRNNDWLKRTWGETAGTYRQPHSKMHMICYKEAANKKQNTTKKPQPNYKLPAHLVLKIETLLCGHITFGNRRKTEDLKATSTGAECAFRINFDRHRIFIGLKTGNRRNYPTISLC